MSHLAYTKCIANDWEFWIWKLKAIITLFKDFEVQLLREFFFFFFLLKEKKYVKLNKKLDVPKQVRGCQEM